MTQQQQQQQQHQHTLHDYGFRIEQTLGTGGFGVMYLCENERLAMVRQRLTSDFRSERPVQRRYAALKEYYAQARRGGMRRATPRADRAVRSPSHDSDTCLTHNCHSTNTLADGLSTPNDSFHLESILPGSESRTPTHKQPQAQPSAHAQPVWRARHDRHARIAAGVAMLFLPSRVALKAQQRDTLRREEIACGRALRHPNLRALYQIFYAHDYCYMVFAYVEGVTLRDWINTHGAFDEPYVQRVTRQLLDALRYCHSMGVAHRDVKLDNVIVHSPRYEHVTLMDFGLAHLERGLDADGSYWSASSTTRTSLPCGSQLYMAPDVWLCEAQTPAAFYAADVYSVGVMVYAMLHGALPFRTEHYQRARDVQNYYRKFARLATLSESSQTNSILTPINALYCAADCSCVYCKHVRPPLHTWLRTYWRPPTCNNDTTVSSLAQHWLLESMAPLVTERHTACAALEHHWLRE